MGDWFDSAVDTVTGIFSGAGDALGSAADWTTNNPGAANLLGGALMAGGSYLENRETIKNQKEMQEREWARRDLYGGAIGGEATQYHVTPPVVFSCWPGDHFQLMGQHLPGSE